MTIDDEFKIWLSKTLDAKFAAQEAAIREMLLSLATAGFEQEISKGAGVASMPLSEISDLVPKMELEFGEKDDKESETGSPGVQAPVPRLGKHILSEKLAPDPPFKVFVKRSLDSYMSLVVIINLVFIAAMTEFQAAQADYGLGMAKHAWHGVSENTFEVAEYVFFSIYFFDLAVRIIILRKEWYYDRIEGWMYLNMFDAVLVMINIFEWFALPALYMGDQHQNATPIRVIKLVRIIRTLRIFKTVSLFRQLRILVGTCVASIGALFWSMVLLMVLQIGFALAICQALQLFIADEREELADRLEMRQYYGNFLKTVYTMFEITFSGSWPARVRPVTSKVSGWYAIPFLSYIALVVFAVIKIVTALFLKETLHSAANDADMMLEDSERVSKAYQNKIEGLFRLADNDGDGLLTLQEFMETMNLRSVQHYLKVLDVTVNDSRILFDILDDGDGLVTITEFCQGISKLRGNVKPIDFVTLRRENSRILKECRHTSKDVRHFGQMLRALLNSNLPGKFGAASSPLHSQNLVPCEGRESTASFEA